MKKTVRKDKEGKDFTVIHDRYKKYVWPLFICFWGGVLCFICLFFLRQTYLSLHFFVHFLFTCQVTARLQCRVSQVCYYDVPTAWIKHKSLNSLLAGNYFLAVWSPATLVSFSCMEEGSRTAGYVLSQTTLCAFEHR